jgi:hypothetical protein
MERMKLCIILIAFGALLWLVGCLLMHNVITFDGIGIGVTAIIFWELGKWSFNKFIDYVGPMVR